ncbi:hypothetical protein VTN31DRAFT_5849 [Thermomyces dupontii]|uniref:uncharacterized protein n=1 Tax=Talaromyces thermophilus TaxID=28565 RepID=UPI003742CA46
MILLRIEMHTVTVTLPRLEELRQCLQLQLIQRRLLLRDHELIQTAAYIRRTIHQSRCRVTSNQLTTLALTRSRSSALTDPLCDTVSLITFQMTFHD